MEKVQISSDSEKKTNFWNKLCYVIQNLDINIIRHIAGFCTKEKWRSVVLYK
jgi:hypothetical protein